MTSNWIIAKWLKDWNLKYLSMYFSGSEWTIINFMKICYNLDCLILLIVNFTDMLIKKAPPLKSDLKNIKSSPTQILHLQKSCKSGILIESSFTFYSVHDIISSSYFSCHDLHSGHVSTKYEQDSWPDDK